MNKNNIINDFRKKWILSNIIDNNFNISFFEISSNLGLTGSSIVDLLCEMQSEELIKWNKNLNKVEITLGGRVLLNDFLYKKNIDTNCIQDIIFYNSKKEHFVGKISKKFITVIRKNKCTY